MKVEDDFGTFFYVIVLSDMIRVIEFLRIFEFRNLHLMRGGLILPNSISEEKLKIE